MPSVVIILHMRAAAASEPGSLHLRTNPQSAGTSLEAYLSKARSDLVKIDDGVAVQEDELLLASPGPQGAKTESWQSREATIAAPVGNVGSTGSTVPLAAQLNSTGNSSHDGSGGYPSTGSKFSQEDRHRDPTIRSTSRASGISTSGRGTPQPAWGVPLNEWGEPEQMDTKTLLKQICEASGKKGKQVYTKVEGADTSANAQPTVMSKSLEGDLEALKKMIDADPSAANSVDGEGYSGLHFAASYGHTECAKLLLASGSQANLKASSSGVTPLHLAARGGHAALLSQLIEAGASVNDVDKNRMTALHNASGLGTVDCAMILLDAGADLEAKDGDLWTCVHYAARFNNIDTVQKLLERGASPNDGDVDGWTPIHNCARNGRLKCMQLLLAKEGNILLQNKEGETPLHIAVRKSKMTIVRCMMTHAEKGGIVEELRSVRDKQGRSVDDVQTSAHIQVRCCLGVGIWC